MGWWIAAVLCAGAALASGLGRRHQARKLAHLLAARPSSVGELLDLQTTVATELGAGAFRDQVKLTGTIACTAPLTAPWSGEPCVAYCDTTTALVEVETETTTTEADGSSHTERRWERRDEQLHRDHQRCRFALEDGNQRIDVNPAGADLDLETVVSTLEPPSGLQRPGRRLLGIRREEAILRAHGPVFVVAHCSDAGGRLQLEAPSQEGLFVVRRGNEDQFSLGLRRWRRLWMLSSWGFSGLSLALVLAALRS